MKYIVEFHADGGQMCVLGRKIFNKKSEAQKFAKEMRNEPGHTCLNSVKLFKTKNKKMKENNPDKIYPAYEK